jgi:hypothetical protein
MVIRISGQEPPPPPPYQPKNPKGPSWIRGTVAILTSSDSISPVLKGVSYTLAWGFASVFIPSKSTLYGIKADMAFGDLDPIWARGYFGKEHFVRKAKNVGQIDVLEDQSDLDEAYKVLNRMQNLPKEMRDKIRVDPNAVPERMITGGICAGIQMDIATRYLINGEKVDSIAWKGESGGSKEAAAAQAVYMLLKAVDESGVETVAHTLKMLRDERAVVAKGSLYDVYTGRITELRRQILTRPEILEAVRNVFEKGSRKDTIAAYLKEHKNTLDEKIGEPLFSGASDHEIEWVGGFLEHELARENRLKSDSKGEFSKFWNQLREAAIKMFGLDKTRTHEVFDRITNPLIREAVLAGYLMRSDTTRTNAVVGLQGIETQSVKGKIGHYFHYQSDGEYFEQFKALDPGFYSITFATSTGYHTVSYIKEADGTHYLLDPNGYQLKADNFQDTSLLFQKLMKLYDFPAGESKRHRILVGQISVANKS